MSRPALCIAGLLFSLPFVLLGVRYGALPAEIAVLRIPGSHAAAFAAKSAFTVFRVPLMNSIHGIMAAVMLFLCQPATEEERQPDNPESRGQ